MAQQSLLAKLGLRSGVLGSSADLAVAAPLATGNYNPAAHTDASRIGWYFDRTSSAEAIGAVVMGVTSLLIGVSTTITRGSAQWLGISAPAVSTAGYGTIYFDSGTNLFMASQNGAAYVPLISAGGTPGGSNTQVQFNDSGAFGGDAGLVYNKTTDVLTIGAAASLSGVSAAGQTTFTVTSAVANDTTTIRARPNGTGAIGALELYNTSSVVDGMRLIGAAQANAGYLATEVFGAGVAKPLVLRSSTAGFSAAPDSVVVGTNGFVALYRTTTGTGAVTNPTYRFQVGDVGSELIYIDALDNLVVLTGNDLKVGTAALATNATDGFLKLSTVAGTPSGVATSGSGALVFDSNTDSLWIYGSGPAWHQILSGGSALTGFTTANNTGLGISAGTALTSGVQNTFIGVGAGQNTATTSNCTAIGFNALKNGTSGANTAIGSGAADVLTSSTGVTAIGLNALGNCTSGASDSTAVGVSALSVANAVSNTAIGARAADGVGSSARITAVGADALGGAVNGASDCTAIGYNALLLCTVASNTAVGSGAADALSTATGVTAVGTNALGAGTTGITDSTAVGLSALLLATGSSNTAVGARAADALTSAVRTTAFGTDALGTGSTGITDCTAIGYQALFLCTAANNTAVGTRAADAVTTATGVTAVGLDALGTGSTGVTDCTAVGLNALVLATSANNTAVGARAGDAISTGANNTAVGTDALGAADTVADNTAIGFNALLLSTATGGNTAVGARAGDAITTGTANTAIGVDALGAAVTNSDATAVGFNALLLSTSVGGNTAVGARAADALTSATGVTAIGTDSLGAGSTGITDCTAVGFNALLLATGASNTAVGARAGDAVTSGASNTAVGVDALGAAVTVSDNTAVGFNALTLSTATGGNTAVGARAADAVTSGTGNTAVGVDALGAAVTVADNTAIGFNALLLTTGLGNTAVGSRAGDAMTTGFSNVMVGTDALGSSTASFGCVAVGSGALAAATGGNDLIAIGADALGTGAVSAGSSIAIGSSAAHNTTTGTRLVAVGTQALAANATGSDNVAVGHFAMQNGSNVSQCTAVGKSALNTAAATVTGSVAVGYNALSSASLTGAANTAIGSGAGSTITSGAGNILLGIDAGDGTVATTSNRFVAGSNTQAISNVWFGKGETNATPTSYTVNGTGGSGTDIAGANIVIAGGRGTGTGAGGVVDIQVAPAGSTGASLNALVSLVQFISTSSGYTAFQRGIIYPATSVSGNTNLTTAHYTVLADTSGGNVTLTLPASPVNGQLFNLKNVSGGTNTFTIARNGNNIDGAAADLTTTTTNVSWTLQYVTGFGWAIL